MTIKQLYNRAVIQRLQDDEVEEVIEYFTLNTENKLLRGTCAECSLRKTDRCAFPHESRLIQPICTSFEPWQQ